jgi:hypothetical protein
VQLLEELLAELALGLLFRGQAAVGAEADVGDGNSDPRRRRAGGDMCTPRTPPGTRADPVLTPPELAQNWPELWG